MAKHRWEWLGSLMGSAAFVALRGWALGNLRPFVASSLMFFLAHSAGYFGGGLLMGWVLQSHEGGLLSGLPRDLVGVLGKLSWGLEYGTGFGAGLGSTFHACQRRP